MEYKNDKGEFIAFIKAGLDNKENKDIDVCLERVTKPVKEQFLNDRAELYKADVNNDPELMEAFRILDFICNEKEQGCCKCPLNKYCNTYIENVRKNVSDDSLKMIDLFCGAGGLSLGFTQEGFVTSLANDIQDCCVDTYAHNHPETPRDHIVLGDIKDVVKNLDEKKKRKKLSSIEKKLLNTAKQIVLSEIICSYEIDTEKAEELLANLVLNC